MKWGTCNCPEQHGSIIIFADVELIVDCGYLNLSQALCHFCMQIARSTGSSDIEKLST